MTMPRLFFIGLDAADKDLVEQWALEGLLPNFRKLLGTALQGDIENPRGLEAGSCWPTLFSGLQPGQTGQFDGARQFDKDIYDHVPFLQEESWHPPIWSTLSDAGKLCAVIDAPYSPGTSNINGIKIVDRGAHAPAAGGNRLTLRTHPPALAREIEEHFGPDPAGGYVSDFFPLHTAQQIKEFRDIYIQRIINKTSLTLHYWHKRQWDFFMSVFTEAHCVAKRCWHLHDVNDPAFDFALAEETGNPLRDIYIELDRAMGRLIEAIGDEARMIIYLSHGFAARRDTSHLLERALRCLEDPTTSVPSDTTSDDPEGRRYFASFGNDRTAGLRINLNGREARGIVSDGAEYQALCDELIGALLELRDTETGAPLVRNVMRVRDWHRGRHIDKLPDLLVTWHVLPPVPSESVRKNNVMPLFRTKDTNDRGITGRFFAIAPDWPYRKLSYKVRAEDFVPTIAALFSVDVDYTDGRAIPSLAVRPETSGFQGEFCFYTQADSRL